MDLPVKKKKRQRDWDGAQKSTHTLYRALGFVLASCVVVVTTPVWFHDPPSKEGKDHSQENVKLEALHCTAVQSQVAAGSFCWSEPWGPGLQKVKAY